MITNNYLLFKKHMNTDFSYGTVNSDSDNLYTVFSDIHAIENSWESSTQLWIYSKLASWTSNYTSSSLSIINSNANIYRVDLVKPSTATTFDVTDYDIANQISNLTMTNVTNNVTNADGKVTNTVTATFSNTNSSEITINSVGLYHTVYFAKTLSNMATQSNKFLMAEIPLDTPLTVPANTGFTITVLWED